MLCTLLHLIIFRDYHTGMRLTSDTPSPSLILRICLGSFPFLSQDLVELAAKPLTELLSCDSLVSVAVVLDDELGSTV